MNTPRSDRARTRRVAASGRPPSPAHAYDTASTRAQKLATEAAEAAEVRAYETHPDVIALRVERVRSQVDRLCWTGIVLGLAFTMTNVQSFAAAGATAWSLPWLAAWLLDPTVSLVLLAILRAEQVTARYQVQTGPWTRRAKWFSITATYLMNTWSAFAAGSPSQIVLHSVPPLLVFTAAEAITDLRDKLTEAVAAAFTEAAGRTEATDFVNTTSGGDQASEAVSENSTAGRSQRRKLYGDYLAEARAAWTPEVAITPAWVRQITGCSRGLSSRLATALAAEVAEPDATSGTQGASHER